MRLMRGGRGGPGYRGWTRDSVKSEQTHSSTKTQRKQQRENTFSEIPRSMVQVLGRSRRRLPPHDIHRGVATAGSVVTCGRTRNPASSAHSCTTLFTSLLMTLHPPHYTYPRASLLPPVHPPPLAVIAITYRRSPLLLLAAPG